MFRIKEYHNLYNVIAIGYHAVKIYLIYFLYGEVSKENYKLHYREEQGYDNSKNVFLELRKQNQDGIFNIIWYSIATMSLYSYKRYKEDNNYIEKLKELNTKINTNISLEDALKIIDIKLDAESLNKILEGIEEFRNRIIKE